MSQDGFEFLFDAFDDAEPDMLMEAALGLEDPPKREESPYDTLEFLEVASSLDYFPLTAMQHHASFPGSMEDAHVHIESSESDFGVSQSLQDISWHLGTLGFDDPSSSVSPPYCFSVDYLASPPFSPDTSGSSPSMVDNCPSPPASVLSYAAAFDAFRDGILYDPSLVSTYEAAICGIARNVPPTREQVREFVQQGPKTFVCAVDTCEWHTKGWKREDRGIAHVLKEHFRVLTFPCTLCERVYKWPHDLTKHRLLKHRNPGDEPPAKFPCSVCPQSFDKSSNLTRHVRNVHRKPGGRRAAKARQEH